MPDLTQVTQLGVQGLAVFLLYKIAANHIDHNTDILKELRDVIRDLNEFLKNHIKTK